MEALLKDLSPKQVAAQLGVDTRTVTKWLKAKVLLGYKAGPKLWRIKQIELDRFRAGILFPESPSLDPGAAKVLKTPKKTEKSDGSDV